jgi:hypothetical protein
MEEGRRKAVIPSREISSKADQCAISGFPIGISTDLFDAKQGEGMELAEGSSWLQRILTLFGHDRPNPPSWQEREANGPLSDQERYLIESLPFERHVVHGARAIAAWERLRSANVGYPIIVGDDDSLMRLAECREFDERDAAEILTAATVLQMPDAMGALRTHEHERAIEYLRSHGRGTKPEDLYEPPIGDWPLGDEDLAQSGPALADDVLEGRPLAKVNILLVSAKEGSEVAAQLRYGAWNDCPPSEYHVAMLRSWHERYGAELVSMGADTVELRVKQRPGTRDEALALAREHYAYCNDTVDQGTNDLATLAAILMVSDWWFFWWD